MCSFFLKLDDMIYGSIHILLQQRQVQMGNVKSNEETQILTFMQVLEDPHFGQVEVYRSKEGLFLMKMIKSAICGDKRHQDFVELMSRVTAGIIPNIVPIVRLHTLAQNGVCIKYQRVQIFTEYYNYTLSDLRTAKRELDESQLWFLLSSLLDLAVSIKHFSYTVNLCTENVFLTPAGTPCVYHYHLRSCKDSVKYQEFTIGQCIGKIILQMALSEKIEDSTQEELLQKMALFDRLVKKHQKLGQIIKNLMQKIYSEQEALCIVTSMQEKEIITVAREIKLLKFKYNLPQNPQFLLNPCKTHTQSVAKLQKENNTGNPLSRSTIRTPLAPNVSNISSEVIKKTLQTENSDAKSRPSAQKSSAKKRDEADACRSKEETGKMLNEIQRRKEQYRLQKQRFQMRKEQLLHGQKQNRVRVKDMRQSQRRKDTNNTRTKIANDRQRHQRLR